jgi:hypothetical protein
LENGVASSKKKVSSKRTSFRSQIDDITWQFSEEFTSGNIPKVSTYINRFHGPNKAKQILLELLISTKLAYLASHPRLACQETDESISNLIKMFKNILRGA